MADDFHTGICSLNWWNLARSEGIDGSAMSSAAPPASCSAAIIDMGGGGEGFSWTAAEMGEGKAGSCDEPAGSASGSSITFQDTHKARTPDNMVGGPMIKPTFQVPGFGLSPSGMDWTQPSLLRRNGRGETSFQAMLQDDLNSKPFFRHDPSIDSDEAQAGSAYPFKGMNQSFLLDQHRLSSGGSPVDCSIDRLDSFQLSAASYGTVLQTLIEPDTKPQRSIYDNPSVSYHSPMTGYRGIPTELSQTTWPKSSQLLKASPPNHRSTNQLQFSNNTPFWNASAAGFYPPTPTQFTVQTFEQKPNSSKSNSEGARESSSSSSMTKKSSSGEPASKKPRIETPSPLPTFKVRKEKLGDRITALQQLVSPFGKTDTASVLHDAIEYIKFLHDQVNVLSTPYLKNGHPMQQQNPDKLKIGEGPKQDLRSRGLCLVPISSTYQVASETPVDFWNPTFGGTYR